MAKHLTTDQLIAGLFAMGWTDPSEEMLQQFGVVMGSISVFDQKDRIYGSAWKRLGALNNLTRMATKVERLLEQFWHNSSDVPAVPDLDDAYDLINYSAFFIRQASSGEWTRGQ